ncbi:B-cell receptor CD22-like [Hyla sarda]|uniref:B-cell receptor CD22-like n=1 Tax=Hyla sarda TaxID=327740 RepID=UPI0024C3806D|nr:B-cell receptor CD22-like [Hyla sarda]
MGMKLIFLLIVFQGFHLGFVCWGQRTRYIVRALLGSCVELPCAHRFGDSPEMSGVVWYAGNKEILNTKNSSSVLEEYRNRTSLVPGEKSCTLRIDPVRREDGNDYYSRSSDDITPQDSYRRYSKYDGTHLYVTGSPRGLQVHVSANLTEENATTIRCSVEHTCGSSPPTIRWNKPGQITKYSTPTWEGWTEESKLTYIPFYVDDGSRVQCTATYPNGQNAQRSAELRILFAPKHVTATIIEKGEILEGSDVNLMCISISKPEVNMYEWYKGENRTLLPYTRWKMTVHNVTRDMEPYSCAAINTVGRGESALMKIPVLCEGSSYSFTESKSNVILLATIGTVGPLLLLLVVYLYWRKRCRKGTSREVVESPDATYSDLVKNDIAEDYEELRPMNSKYVAMGGHVGAGNQHENTHKKNGKTVQSFA